MVMLWTDALLFLLVAAITGLVLYSRRKAHLRRPWAKVMQSRVGVASMVVLLVFVLVGLLDSIHFHPRLAQSEASDEARSIEVLSVLDVLLTPIRTRDEKTYSAPFATQAYAREMLEQPGGAVVWDYPRLTYGGAHLGDQASQQPTDIMDKTLAGLMQGASVWSLLVLALLIFPKKGVPSDLRQRGELIKQNQPLSTALVVLLVLLLVGCAVGQLSAYYHVLGTDKVGQDVLYQAIKSIRTGLVIGTLTTMVMLPLAIFFGLYAGFFRGWVDDVIQYIYTTLNCIPGVLLIAAAVLVTQVYLDNHLSEFVGLAWRADIRLLCLCLILGITSWTGLCRLLRAETLKIREMDYVQAALCLGVRRSTILRRHVLPNVLHLVTITVVLDFSGLVLAEAVLSYINIGVDPSTHSWGNMINSARLEMAREPIVWWSLMAAFVFMFTLVLAANLFADVVRDAFDPRSV